MRNNAFKDAERRKIEDDVRKQEDFIRSNTFREVEQQRRIEEEARQAEAALRNIVNNEANEYRRSHQNLQPTPLPYGGNQTNSGLQYDNEMEDIMRQIALQEKKDFETRRPAVPRPPDNNAKAFANLLGDKTESLLGTKGVADLLGSTMNLITAPENRAALEQKQINELNDQLAKNEALLAPLKLEVSSLRERQIIEKGRLDSVRNVHKFIKADIQNLESECREKELERDLVLQDVDSLNKDLAQLEQEISFARQGLVLNEDPLLRSEFKKVTSESKSRCLM